MSVLPPRSFRMDAETHRRLKIAAARRDEKVSETLARIINREYHELEHLT